MSFFPVAVPTTLQLLQAKNNTKVVLDGGINDVITTIPVVDTTDIPASGFLTFEDGTYEVIEYTGKTLTTLTGCTRGAGGTTPSSHANGTGIGMWDNAQYHNILSGEIGAICQNLSDRMGLHGTRIILQDYLDANSKKISGLAAGSVAGDAVRYEQLVGIYLPLAGGTMTGALLAAAGSVGSPSISFVGNSNTGLYWASSNQFRIATNGVDRLYFGAFDSGVLSNPFYVQDGNAALPGLGFFNDVNTGFYRLSADAIGVSTGGVAQFQFAGGNFGVVGTNTIGQIYGSAGSASVPSFSFNVAGSTDTGFYLIGAGILGVSIDGAAMFQFNGATLATTGTNTAGQILSATGSAAAPSFTFNVGGATSTGIYYIASSTLAFATGGTLAAIFDSAQNLDLKAHRLINGSGVQGTITNNNATAGDVGEYIESVVSTPTDFAATGVWDDLTSISLTAGDWDISALLYTSAAGATFTEFAIGISTVSGNSSAGLIAGSNYLFFIGSTVAADSGGSVPVFRVSLSSTTTYYLKRRADYSAGGPPHGNGRLSARRVR